MTNLYDLPEDLLLMIYEKVHKMKLKRVFDELFSKMYYKWESSWEWGSDGLCTNCGDPKEQCEYKCYERCDVISGEWNRMPFNLYEYPEPPPSWYTCSEDSDSGSEDIDEK